MYGCLEQSMTALELSWRLWRDALYSHTQHALSTHLVGHSDCLGVFAGCEPRSVSPAVDAKVLCGRKAKPARTAQHKIGDQVLQGWRKDGMSICSLGSAGRVPRSHLTLSPWLALSTKWRTLFRRVSEPPFVRKPASTRGPDLR